MRFLRHQSEGQPVMHVAIYDGVREQVRAVHAASQQGKIKYRVNEYGADWVGRAFRNWEDVVGAVEGRWPEGIQLVEDMTRQLQHAKLPPPVSLRPRKSWSEDDGSEIDLERLQEGLPFWRTLRRQPVCGPRVISLTVQTGGNAHWSPQQLLWRGAVSLVLARILENAGYRTEIISYDTSVHTMTDGSGVTQLTTIKRSQDKLNIPTLVNALSGWYYRTVSFGSMYLVPEMVPVDSLGRATPLERKVLDLYARTKVEPWMIQGVHSQQGALALARTFLEGLGARDRGRVVVP